MKISSDKIMHFGIALILFSIYAIGFKGGGESVYESVIAIASAIFPLVGLLLCVISFFKK